MRTILITMIAAAMSAFAITAGAAAPKPDAALAAELKQARAELKLLRDAGKAGREAKAAERARATDERRRAALPKVRAQIEAAKRGAKS